MSQPRQTSGHSAPADDGAESPAARRVQATMHWSFANVMAALLLAALLTAGLAPSARPATPDGHATAIEMIWEDDFSAAEQARLAEWVARTQAAVDSLVGPFPMAVRVHFHRRDDAPEPVPWAHTGRGPEQSVHLHVDPAYPLQDLLADWTAPHEFSHLILPYVGRADAWFAEGFASYLQYPVMQRMGVLSARQAAERLAHNHQRARGRYSYPHLSFVEAAPRLREERQYPVMYWGGAAYFSQVDQALQASGTSLFAVLTDYVACCRRDRRQLADLLADLDRLSASDAFSRRYATLAAQPGFPPLGSTAAD